MSSRRMLAALLSIGGLFSAVAMVLAMNREYMPGIEWPEPPVVVPGENGNPPSDAIVLFDGTDLSAWEPSDTWKVEDGVLTEGKGDIRTKQNFGDIQLHIEWSSPNPPRGKDQDRGNSGVFFQDRYELQVLDSYENRTYFEGQAGSIYKQTPPMVNAMRPPGEWNTYDVIWTAPKFNDDGTLKTPAYITALHNGVLILNHFEVLGPTPWTDVPKYEAHGAAPIHLQDHGHPVRFRNIWVRELKPLEGKRVRKPYYHDHDSGKEWPVSEGEEPPANAKVSGKVSVEGRPLVSGTLTFNSDQGDKVTATIKNGDFELNDAKPGKYSVTINSVTNTSIGGKYSDPNQSGLVVEIAEGINAFEFTLTAD